MIKRTLTGHTVFWMSITRVCETSRNELLNTWRSVKLVLGRGLRTVDGEAVSEAMGAILCFAPSQ